jgi:hypothetical protein
MKLKESIIPIFLTKLYCYHFLEDNILNECKKTFNLAINNYVEKFNLNSDSILGKIIHTEDLLNDSTAPLADFILNKSYDILVEQGYLMETFETFLIDFWGQSINKYASHFNHVHPYGSHISGFYFLDVPNSQTFPMFFDPRPSKVQNSLPFKFDSNHLDSKNFITTNVSPGDLIITNSWLGHGFEINLSEFPLNFIHFNIGVISKDNIYERE